MERRIIRENFRKVMGGCLIVLILILCAAGWRGLHRHTETAVLRETYLQAKKKAIDENAVQRFSITFKGKKGRLYQADYQALELTDEQFADVRKNTAEWVEQETGRERQWCFSTGRRKSAII